MDWNKLKGFVLDVDGTLYSQKKMRIRMLGRLLAYYVPRPDRLRELYALFLFRKLREQSEWKRAGFEDLFLELEKKAKLPAARIEERIRYWMFRAPLDSIKACAFRDVIAFINRQHRDGKRIIVYSDYPAADKLKALGMAYDLVFAFEENGISEQKPSRRIMETIVSESGCRADQLLYVGDRDDRDRASAETVSMPYCDIRQFRRIIGSAEEIPYDTACR